MPMTIALDVLPLGRLLDLVADTVLKTAAAAVDLCVENRSFNELSDNWKSIHAILVNLRDRNLGEVPAVSCALESLYKEVKKADDLLRKVKNYSHVSRMMWGCHTLKEIHSAASDISRALETLKLACFEVDVDLVDNIKTVCEQLRHMNFTADQGHLAILEEIYCGIREPRKRRQTANSILNSIARRLGCSQESPQISHEIESLRKDKEDAALNKALQDEYLLGQVISLLSCADAVFSLEESRAKYAKLKANYCTGPLEPPLNAFNCPISAHIMRDPVTASNHKTYERTAIEEWFEKNGFTDPDTHDELPDGKLRPNRALFECIDEWTEQRNVALILRAKFNLQSGNEAEKNEACLDLSCLCEESSVYKDWIAFEDMIPSLINILESPKEQSAQELKKRSLHCLLSLVQNNETNKSHVVEADGIRSLVKCLGRKPCLAKVALMLLAEMVNNNLAREKMERLPSFFMWVVTRRRTDEDDDELTRIADHVLDQLSDKDENIVKMLEANWFDPLLNKLCQGTDDDKRRMAYALSRAKIYDANKQTLAKRDVVHALVTMLRTGDMHSQLASLEALQMLSSSIEIRQSMTEAGAVPVLLDLFSNGTLTVLLIEPAIKIFVSLICNNGSKYLVDTQGLPLQEAVVKLLLGVLHTSDSAVNLDVLKCLSELAHGSASRNVRDLIREMLQVAAFKSFLTHGKSEIREHIVLLLSYLSADEGESKVTIFLNEKATLELLAEQMQNLSAGSITQTAAASIIANLSSGHRTMSVTMPVLQGLLGMLVSNDANVIESALDALQNLTDRHNVDMQVCLAGLDIFSCLKQTLTSTSSVAKIRAATILRNFSLSTESLVANLSVKGHFWHGSASCKVHLGKCEAKTTLCIIKANLVPQLVALLSDGESQVAEAGMDALSTLFSCNSQSNSQSRNAAQLLYNARVLKPLSHWLTCESHSCSEKAQILYNQIEELLVPLAKFHSRWISGP